jgi:polysaccharide biosynthesis transport protein
MNLQRNSEYLEGDDNQREPESPELGGGFGLVDILRIIRVRRSIIFGTAALVVAITAVVLFQRTPLYTAQAVVLVDSRQNKIESDNAALSDLASSTTEIQNQTYILQSRALMSRVVDKLHLLDNNGGGNVAPMRPSFLDIVLFYINPMHWLPAPSSQQQNMSTKQQQLQVQQQMRDSIVNYLQGYEDIRPLGMSSAIAINFTSTDPQSAAMFSNAIADAYVDDQLAAKFEASQRVSQWLADRTRELAMQVQAAEAAVQEYKAENSLTEVGNGSSLVNQQLSDLNGQLIIAKSDLAEKEARYARVLQLQRTGHAEDVTQVVDSPLINQLRGQEADLMRQQADMSSKYGPRHPKMLDVESQVENLKAKIAEEVQRVAQTTASDVAIARTRVNSLQNSLNSITGQSTVDSKARVKLAELEAKATSSRQLYEAFLERFKQAQGVEGIQTPDARILSRAIEPSAPSSPQIFLDLVIAAPAGLMLGLLLAFLAEKLDDGFRTAPQVERQLKVPVLATIPEIPGLAESGKHAIDRIIDRPTSSFTEAMRGLHMGLLLSNVDRKPKIILVTSAVPDEGKTTVAIALARLAAQGGKKAIVIDADLRRPSVAVAVGLPPERNNGLERFLAGETSLEESIVPDTYSSASILPAAKVSGSPSDLLSSATMERLIESLRSYYDLIVIDSSPLLPVNDTKAVAGLADAVLLAVRWEKTPREAVIQAIRVLNDVHAAVAGVALTRADSERYRYYAYGYQDYQAYNKYYGD